MGTNEFNRVKEEPFDADEALSVIRSASQAAGKVVLDIRNGGNLEIEHKSKERSNIVTKADKESEQVLSKIIHEKFPTHSIRGEEGTNQKSDSEYEWILDPIDGSLNFSEGRPFSISIGLVHNGAPVLGVLYFPDDDVTISSMAGKGVFINGKKVERHETKTLAEAKVGFDVSSGGNAMQEETMFRNPIKAASTDRIFCATYAARLILEGKLDAYVCGGGLTPYDLGAMTLILREAGCVARGLKEEGINFSQEKTPFIAGTDDALIKDILGEVIAQEQKKRSFFDELAHKYPGEMRLLFQGGHLSKKEKWRNVVEHCLVQTAAAEELCSLLQLSPKEAKAVCSTSAIHDWKKRWEKEDKPVPPKAEKIKEKLDIHQDLLDATNPDRLAELYLNQRTFTPLQELQFYLDIITKESDIVPSEERIQEVEASPRSKGMAEKAEGQYWQKTRELRDRVEQRLFEQLKQAGYPIASPAAIPFFIRKKIEEKWDRKTA